MNIFRLLSLLSLSTTLLLFGCNQSEPQDEATNLQPEAENRDIEKKLELLTQRIEQLEVEQVKLIRGLEERNAEAAEIVADGETLGSEQIESLIEAQVADRIDTVQQQRVAEIALREIESYEERKTAAEEAEREARRQERDARRQEREQERVNEIAQNLGLNDQQAEELLAARSGLRTTIREVFDYMREQGDFDRSVMRETMTELRTQHQQILSEFLTDEQLKKYLDQHSFNPGMGRGRR